MSHDFESLVMRIAACIAAIHPYRILRVAIDGADGVGKTTLADAVAGALSKQKQRSAIRISADDFHYPRAIRYERGRHSPDGHFLDSYDYDSMRRLLLDPLDPAGTHQFVPKIFDVETDRPVPHVPQQADPKSALIVEGLFLNRPELRDYWDLSIFLKAPFEISVPRGAQRGPGYGSPDPLASSNVRYVEAQKRYLTECAPADCADIVVDYEDCVSLEF